MRTNQAVIKYVTKYDALKFPSNVLWAKYVVETDVTAIKTVKSIPNRIRFELSCISQRHSEMNTVVAALV